MRKLVLAFGASVFLLSATASAHFNLEMPPPPKPSTDGKGPPPCGPDTTDGTITPVMGGSELTVAINETVDHGGFYRVALSLTNCKTDPAKCFPADNKVYDSKNMALNPTGPGTSDHADYDMNPKFPILADHLFAHPIANMPKKYSGKVTLPNVNCDQCTLQVIEFMEQHGPNGSAGYFYHHCADLKITADPGKPIFDPMGGGGSGGSGGTGGAGGAGGSATAGGGAGGTAGASAGASTGGTTSVGTSGTATTGGTATSAGGTGTSAGGTGGTGTVTNPGSGSSSDDGGCGFAAHGRGGASLLAALGLGYALVRRRRAS